MKKLIFVVLALCASSTHAGVFGSEDSSSAITKETARTMNKVQKGVVLQVSEAKIEESNGTRNTGALAGAAAGADIGSSGRGGLLGGIAGQGAGERRNRCA